MAVAWHTAVALLQSCRVRSHAAGLGACMAPSSSQSIHATESKVPADHACCWGCGAGLSLRWLPFSSALLLVPAAGTDGQAFFAL
jgi:hypothetical protein